MWVLVLSLAFALASVWGGWRWNHKRGEQVCSSILPFDTIALCGGASAPCSIGGEGWGVVYVGENGAPV